MVYGYRYRKHLFGFPYDGDEPTDLARCYFDNTYDRGSFLQALSYWVQKIGFGMDGAHGNFGDKDDPEECFRFEGFEIEIGFDNPPNILRIDEATFFRWLRMACDRYVQQNPKDKQRVEELLAKAPM